MEILNSSVIDWSRAQFALTAMYHWLFVPLTLGLGVLMSIMETAYVRTGKEQWKKTAQFWQTIFGINFAIGVATGLILEFQFGTNWSNYSWLVGDIFGAPLAIEGIVAFFMEATFISIMFFGWKRVSKKMHLASTWLTVLGATISALWILVANGWMQFPAGTEFNPATGRFEMTDFFAVAFSPMAVTKFCHTVLSAWILGSVFVIGIASWYLLKKRNTDFALKSIKVAAIFGLVASALTAVTGDTSAKVVADKQPMKLAAMEGLYHGGEKADLVTFAIPNPGKSWNNEAEKSFLFSLPSVPGGLSWLATSDTKAYIPGITDILLGDTLPDGSVLLSFAEKQKKGNEARTALAAYQQAAIAKDSLAKSSDKAAIAALEEQMDEKAAIIKANEKYLGYGYLEKPEDAIPNVQITFWSFHIMVYLGGFFILLFLAVVWFHYKKQLAEKRWLQRVALWSIPLAYIAGMAGWMVAEIGRQPWAIQDFLPLNAAISRLTAYSVMITFFLFLALFTALAIAEVRIMLNQIKKGPAEVETAAPDTENS